MRARDIIGKTIKAVRQSRRIGSGEVVQYSVDSIEFTDGSRLVLNVAEEEDAGDYTVEGHFYSARTVALYRKQRETR